MTGPCTTCQVDHADLGAHEACAEHGHLLTWDGLFRDRHNEGHCWLVCPENGCTAGRWLADIDPLERWG